MPILNNLQINDFDDKDNIGSLFVDCTDSLKTSVKFSKNKSIPFHRWYPFVEGFSEDFIKNTLKDVDFKDIKCLEPFAGSGTTPLTLQNKNITCFSFEVSPFMHLLTKVKLRTNYTSIKYEIALSELKQGIEVSFQNIAPLLTPPLMSSMVKGSRKKWLFHKSTIDGILDIKFGISCVNDPKYRDLFKIALASILLEVSNVYRNGKCVSYKKDWDTLKFTRNQVIETFFKQISEKFTPDIENLQFKKDSHGKLFSNSSLCHHGDVRKSINNLNNNFFNLVITSPPYLNSRDYTDTYMVELWLLDLVQNYPQVRKLRKSTVRSHVQIKWDHQPVLNILSLKDSYNEILKNSDAFWNESIPDMIAGYFNDMDNLFSKLSLKMVHNGKVYFNVANSAYYGVHIRTDEIIAEIAEKNGFILNEVKIARYISPSSQQKETIENLRESIIVLTKK